MNKKSVQKYSIAILALLLIQTFSSISMGYSQNSYLRSSYMAPKGERYSRPDIIDASGSLGIKKTNILNGISISHPFWNLGMFTLNTISNVIMIYDAPMYARSLFISIKVTSFEPVERDLDVKIKTHDSNNFYDS